MPIIKSAKKRVRQSEQHRTANMRQRRDFRAKVKAAYAAIETKDSKATELIVAAQAAIDKAVKANILHANTAGRQKSQLMKKAKGLLTAKPAAPKKASPAKKPAAKKPAAKKTTKK